jgi:tRNA-intron lyase
MFVKLLNNHCKIENNNLKSQLAKKEFGFKKGLDYFIDLYEAYYLLNKKKIKIKDTKEINNQELLEICKKKIKDFETKYLVYEDFRNLGKIIKDGTTFGFDFRVYEKKNNHTDYVVDVKKTEKDSLKNFIKSERLATTINTKYVLCIVTLEKKIIKIKIEKM